MIHNAMVVAEGIYQVDTLGMVFSTLPVYFRSMINLHCTSGWRECYTEKSHRSIIYESYFNVIRRVLPFRSSVISNI